MWTNIFWNVSSIAIKGTNFIFCSFYIKNLTSRGVASIFKVYIKMKTEQIHFARAARRSCLVRQDVNRIWRANKLECQWTPNTELSKSDVKTGVNFSFLRVIFNPNYTKRLFKRTKMGFISLMVMVTHELSWTGFFKGKDFPFGSTKLCSFS